MEEPGFIAAFGSPNPKYKFPSRHKIASLVLDLLYKEVEASKAANQPSAEIVNELAYLRVNHAMMKEKKNWKT